MKLIMSRAEVLAATGPTSGIGMRVKMGADRDGRLVLPRPSWSTRQAPILGRRWAPAVVPSLALTSLKTC